MPESNSHESKFVSHNLPLEEYLVLSRSKRTVYQSDADKLNHRWIEAQFRNLGANWTIVTDGHVVRQGISLGDYPEEDEIRELQRRPENVLSSFSATSCLLLRKQSTRSTCARLHR